MGDDLILRPAISALEQYKHMVSHGIRFEICSKQQAVDFLTNNTYYFKIKAFNNNFSKNNNGVYDRLDFAYLQDIAAIDYRLRMLILKMTGSIEHALRIRFNNLLTATNEDGYQILRLYHKNEKAYNPQYDINSLYKKSVYTEGMIAKFKTIQPIWLLWETCSLSDLIRCYNIFLHKTHYRDITYSLLYGVRLLRNAASHHNCLLIPVSTRVSKTEQLQTLLQELLKESTEDNVESVLLLAKSDPLIHDIACVIISHINLVQSVPIQQDLCKNMQEFSERIRRHDNWYRNPECGCQHLVSRLDAIYTLLTATINFYRKDSCQQVLLLTKPYKNSKRHGRRRPRQSGSLKIK